MVDWIQGLAAVFAPELIFGHGYMPRTGMYCSDLKKITLFRLFRKRVIMYFFFPSYSILNLEVSPHPVGFHQWLSASWQVWEFCWAHKGGIPHPKPHVASGSFGDVVSLLQQHGFKLLWIIWSHSKFCKSTWNAADSFEMLHLSFPPSAKVLCSWESCRLEIHCILTLLYISFLEYFYDSRFVFLVSSE